MGQASPLGCILVALLAALLLGQLCEAAGGPCTSSVVTITVTSVSNLALRIAYPPTQTVNLVLDNDLTVSSSIFFNANYSCTKLTATSRRKVTASKDSFPAIQVRGLNNLLIQNVDFSVPTSSSSAACGVSLPDSTSSQNCPAVHIHSSWGVQLVVADVTGRIDIVKSAQVSVDSITLTSFQAEKALVQVSKSGDGPNRIPSSITISNSYLTGGQIGVLLAQLAVGTIVKNNYIKNPYFTGIQCGQGVHNVGDCMLSQYLDNYFLYTTDFTTSSDASAVYFGTHWVNPGNYLSCNYAVGGKQCIYLDYTSSGVTVDGMICYNMPTGLKLNTGHSNTVTSVLSISQRLPGWISCQNYGVNNCNQDIGQYWDSKRLASYNSAAFQQDYPWLNNFCDLTSYDGVNCNPSGSASAADTGKCSGLPTGNKASIVIVDALNSKNTPTYLSCTGVTVAPSLNSMDWASYTSSAVLFNNYADQDFGLKSGSPVYTKYPNFKSCPKSANGPQTVSSSTYTDNFNVAAGPAAP